MENINTERFIPERKSRKGHNEGTVYERKVTQPDGAVKSLGFAAQISLPNGKRRSIYGKSKKEVRAKLRDAQLDLQAGKLPLETSTMTVGEHLGHWLENAAKPNVSYHTYESYELCVRRRLAPRLGAIKLVQLQPRHIQELYTELNRTLSPKSIRITHVALSQALKLAVEWGMIAQNPAAKVKLPKLRQKEKTILSADQVADLLSATREHRLYALWHVLVTTGMRKGEALGLRWEDLDFDTGMLRIRRQIIRKTGIGLVLQDLKTVKSRRIIPLGDRTLQALREHKTRQNEVRLRSSWWEDRPEYEGMIFSTETGTPSDPATTWATFQRCLKKAELPHVTVHALRDTAITNMLIAGVDAKTVSERVGHGDVSITLRYYVTVNQGMQKDAADRLEALYALASKGR
jgi:integrase